MIEKMNGERFTFENHTRNNDLEYEELIGLIKNEKCGYADEIIGFTVNPAYVNRFYGRRMWGIMFQKNGREFWIHYYPEDFQMAVYRALGEKEMKIIMDGASWNDKANFSDANH